MNEGTSVREHVLKMMSYFNTAEVNSGTIDEASQVNIIMTTLPKSFDQFRSNYEMNKLKFTLTQLLNELATYQSMKRDHKSKTGKVNVAELSSSGTKKKKRFAGKAKAQPKKKPAPNKKKSTKPKVDKSKGKMFPL
ncbi:hypothetical protein ACOSP7_021080 [Xanthoceras sorbifolium]